VKRAVRCRVSGRAEGATPESHGSPHSGIFLCRIDRSNLLPGRTSTGRGAMAMYCRTGSEQMICGMERIGKRTRIVTGASGSAEPAAG